MSTLLAKISIHPGKEEQFEDVMAYMYRRTHDTEKDVLRYEYWRGHEPGRYYCLLSFTDSTAFWRHQASDHHEGQMEKFASCIADLELETVDPVAQASPLPATTASTISANEPSAVQEQAKLFPITEASWWQAFRK